MNKICLASGCLFYNKHSQEGELIEIARNLKVDGIEITLIEFDDALRFALSKESEKWLMSLDFISIHGPMQHEKMRDYLTKERIQEKKLSPIYDKIQEIYNKFNCKRVVIHPPDLPSVDFLSSYNFKISTENMSKKDYILDNYLFEEALKKYEDISLCLDVSHAFTFGSKEVKRIIDNFEDKITSVHFSGTTVKEKDSKTHIKVRNCGKEFLNSIEPIFNLECPIVIEEDFGKNFVLKEVQEEIDYIKNLWVNKK